MAGTSMNMGNTKAQCEKLCAGLSFAFWAHEPCEHVAAIAKERNGELPGLCRPLSAWKCTQAAVTSCRSAEGVSWPGTGGRRFGRSRGRARRRRAQWRLG